MAASIITSVKGDVTYDGIPDTVSLIGVQFGDSNAWQQMSLVIQNGATGRITAIALPDDAAYAPSISLVSLTGKGSDYLNQLYNADGSLREPMEGFVNPLSGLYPIDFDGDGQSSLLAWQRIAGLYNADSLGYFLNTLDWQGGTFVLTDQMVGILGTES